MSSNDIIKIRIATKSDHNNILEGFRNWYWPYEPLSIGFEVTTPSAIEEETFTTVPEKGLSLLATITSVHSSSTDETTELPSNIPNNSSNDGSSAAASSSSGAGAATSSVIEKPIGFLVNGLDYPGLGAELHEKFKNLNCKRMLALINIMDVIEKKMDIFKKYSTDKSFHFLCVAVAPDYRGKSVGRKLFERGFQMAKSLGFKIVSVDCSSYYSIQIAERCKMICVAELKYIDYKDSDGNQIFKPPAPHTQMKRFIKVL